jgi:hypothetical protein
MQRRSLPVLPCFPFLTAPRLPDLSLADRRPPDSRAPSVLLVCPRFCRAECIRGWTFRSDSRKPTSGFSQLAAEAKTFVAVLPSLPAQAGEARDLSIALSRCHALIPCLR